MCLPIIYLLHQSSKNNVF
ncbi:hypothetical protein V3C99_004413 [Haemonchus contortus]